MDFGRRAGALMRLAQGGDQNAYATLLELVRPAVRRYVVARFGDVPWLDDVVQETLVAVHAARHTYDPNRPFSPWLFAIASSRMIDVLRRERRVSSREIATDAVPDIGDRPTSARGEIDVEAIRAALATLPGRQREIIEGLKFQDRSVRELAERLEMSETAVKVSAHRGYRALRRLLGGPHER